MQNSFLKTGVTNVETIVDSETGEIIDVEIKRHSYLANTKEEFLLLYSSMLSVFMNMEQSEIRVFGYLLKYADGITFAINKPMRIEISNSTKLTERTIYNTIKILESKSLIFKHQSGVYQINPRYAFRGSTSERNQALKAIIELGCPDC